MVFSLSAKREGGRKRLFGKSQTAASGRFFRKLIEETAETAARSGLDVVWVDEKKQIGKSFGERYANAFQELFAEGYENVISIGNDCPGISVAILEKAFTALRENTLVLGPAMDGGDYLIGLNRSNFDFERFRDLPWNRSHLHSELLKLAESSGQHTICLQRLADIDDQRSLQQFLKANPFSGISRFVRYLLKEILQQFAFVFFGVKAVFVFHGVPLRGPPGVC